MDTDDLVWLDATAQADLVRRGDISPRELVDAAIARIERLNPQLNAVIHERFAAARAEAAGDDLPDGPFRGVPFLVKDGVCHTAGDPFHCGMRFLKDLGWIEPEDTWLAARFRRAGFVIVGKTNLPELAASITTEPLAYGPSRNPWDTTRTTGGSSGGAAAAVAAAMVPVAHGNDMGGSIRFPASMCGLVGLKPTRARTTLGPDFGEYWGPLTHEHVLTRTVRDTAGVLDATGGAGTGDPYTAPPPLRPYREEIGAPPGTLRVGLRTRRRDGEESDRACVDAAESTVRLLEELGHVVAPAEVPSFEEPIDDAFAVVMAVAIAREVERWTARTGTVLRPEHLEPGNATIATLGAEISGTQYVDAVERMQAWSRRVSVWWEDHDVLVLPTSPEAPFALGDLAPDNPDPDVPTRMGRMVTFTAPFDMTGQPAISLPLHWADGLPIGVQLVAAYGREDVLLRVAAQLETARPWHDRRPPAS